MEFPAFDRYDLVLMGDVLEHLSVSDAQELIGRMSNVREVMIAVPFEYPQGPWGGVESERHIQDDLTHDIFMQRYPGFRAVYFVEGRRRGETVSQGAYYVRE
jgi:hypothetical protein